MDIKRKFGHPVGHQKYFFDFHKGLNLKNPLINHGVPERIRTSDLPLRRGLRYPAAPPGPRPGDTIVSYVWRQGLQNREEIHVCRGPESNRHEVTLTGF